VPLDEVVDLVVGSVLSSDVLAGALAEADDDLHAEVADDRLVEWPAERGQSLELLGDVRFGACSGEHEAACRNLSRLEGHLAQQVENVVVDTGGRLPRMRYVGRVLAAGVLELLELLTNRLGSVSTGVEAQEVERLVAGEALFPGVERVAGDVH